MRLYKVTITPTAHFATTLRGDTLFGQMCWAIKYTQGEGKLKELLKSYSKAPFLIVSDAFPQGYLPKPKMPSDLLQEDKTQKKENRKKIWLTPTDLSNGLYTEAKTDQEISNSDKKDVTIHNALNYKTFMTGESFDPHGLTLLALGAKDIYFLLDETELKLEEFKEALSLVSQMGYGKKSTIGKGRFEYKEEDIKPIEVDSSATTFMTLSPFSPKGLICKNIYYEPFTRFGKFGADRAHKSAFKKPLLLADVASVVEFDTPQSYQYMGRAIFGVSDTHKDAVHQGYSIVLPLKGLSHD